MADSQDESEFDIFGLGALDTEAAASSSACDQSGPRQAATEDASMQDSEVGSNASTLVPGGSSADGEEKTCICCGCSSLVPSPLCAGKVREWSHTDRSSRWCKHCANMARVRFLDTHSSLAAFGGWIEAAPANCSFVKMRALAYFSLKLDPLSGTTRVTLASLEARVTLMQQVLQWTRYGSSNGLPQVADFQPFFVMDLKRAEALFGNPFLQGARAVELVQDSTRILGVLMPATMDLQGRESAPLLVNPSDIARAPLLAKTLFNDDIRTNSDEYKQLFETLSREFLEVRRSQDVALPKDSPSKGSLEFSTELVPFKPPGISRANSMKSEAPSHEAIVPAVCDSAAEGSTPSGKKRRKNNVVENLLVEAMAKTACLSLAEWHITTCDKNLEGLLTRLQNLRTKLLDACKLDDAPKLQEAIDTLSCISEFGNAFKRGYGKTRKPGQLLQLVPPMQAMVDNATLKGVVWHWSLKLLHIEVEFTKLWSEAEYIAALGYMNFETIAKLYSDGANPMPNHRMSASIFVLGILERIFIEKIKLLKANTLQQSLIEFRQFLEVCCDAVPRFPTLPADLNFEEKDRVARFNTQISAMPTLVACALASLGVEGVQAPWPSAIREAQACLLGNPQTRLQTALQSYGAAKILMSKVQGALQRDTVEELATNKMKDLMKSIREEVEGHYNLDDTFVVAQRLLECVVAMTEAMSKISDLAFEELTPLLLNAVQHLQQFGGKLGVEIGRRLAVNLSAPLEVANKLEALTGDTTCLNAPEVHVAMKDLSRATRLAKATMPNWHTRAGSFLSEVKSFVHKVIFPMAREKFDVFTGGLNDLINTASALEECTAFHTQLVDASDALSTLVMSPETNKPISELAGMWQMWVATGGTAQDKAPLISQVYRLRKSIHNLSKVSENADVHLQPAVSFFTHHPFPQGMLNIFVGQRLKACIDEVVSLGDVGWMTDLDAQGWVFDVVAGEPPNLLNVVRLRDGDIIAQLDDTRRMLVSDEFDMDAMPLTKVVNLLTSLMSSFDIPKVSVPFLNDGNDMDALSAAAHLKLRACVNSLVHILMLIDVSLLRITGAPKTYDFLFSDIVKPRAKKHDPVHRTPKQFLTKVLATAKKLLNNATVVCAADTFKAADVQVISTSLPLTKAKTWMEVAAKYIDAARAYVMFSHAEYIEEKAKDLKAACPQWTSWVTDAEYDKEKMILFIKDMPKAHVKCLVQEVHTAMANASTLCSDLGFEGAWGCTLLKGCAKPKVDSALEVLAFAKQTLGVCGAGGALLATPEAQQRKVAASILQSLSSLAVVIPRCLVESLKIMAGKQ